MQAIPLHLEATGAFIAPPWLKEQRIGNEKGEK